MSYLQGATHVTNMHLHKLARRVRAAADTRNDWIHARDACCTAYRHGTGPEATWLHSTSASHLLATATQAAQVFAMCIQNTRATACPDARPATCPARRAQPLPKDLMYALQTTRLRLGHGPAVSVTKKI
jgi:hypothetical protein